MGQLFKYMWAVAVVYNFFLPYLALASPLYRQFSSEGSGRNIRHLPCVSRRTGETGICMFAFTCAKANGTHLGTCIDRFYFGSCCKIDDEPDIFPQDNTIDVDNPLSLSKPFSTSTTTHIYESNDIPGNIDKPKHTVKPITESTSPTIKTTEFTTVRIIEQTKTKPPKIVTKKPVIVESTTQSIKLSTFQTVQNASNQGFSPRPSTTTVNAASTKPQRPSVTNFKATTLKARPTIASTHFSTVLENTVTSSIYDKVSTLSTLAPSTKPSLTSLPLSTFNQQNITSHKPSTVEFTKKPIVAYETTVKPASIATTRPSLTTAIYRNNTSSTSKVTLQKKPVSTTTQKVPLVTRFPPRNVTTGTSISQFASTTPGTINTVNLNDIQKFTTTRKPSTTKKPIKVTTKRPTTINKRPSLTTTTKRTPTISTAAPITTKPIITIITTTTSTTKKPPSSAPTKRIPSTVTKKPSVTTTIASSTTTIKKPTTTILKKNVTNLASTRPTTVTPLKITSTTKKSVPTSFSTTTASPSATTIPSTRPVTLSTTSITTSNQKVTKKPIKYTTTTTTTTPRTTTTTTTTTTSTTKIVPSITTVKSTPTTTTKSSILSTTSAPSTKPLPQTHTTATVSTINKINTTSIPLWGIHNLTLDSNEINTDLDNETDRTTTAPGIVTWTSLSDEVESLTKTPPEYSSMAPETTDADWTPITTPDGWIIIQSPTTEKLEPNVDSEIKSSTTTTTTTTRPPTETVKPTVESTTRKQTTTTTTTQQITTQSTYVDKLSTLATVTVSPEFTEPPFALLNMSNYKEVCGRRLFPESRIVGGDGSTFGKWPWQISLRQWRTSTYLHKCGAALLNENWAITAAHCVQNVLPSDLLLRIGEHDLGNEEEPYDFQERRVQIVASHPNFDPRTFEFDLALMRFYEPVLPFQPNVLPICIPNDDEDYVGQTAYVTGWGRLYEDGPLPSVLQEVAVPVINNSVCEGMYRNAGYIEHIPHIFICAGWRKGGFDSCEGDSGGPLVIQRKRDKRWVLAGVISWGIGCAEPNQPGVYTRISEFREWINQILQF